MQKIIFLAILFVVNAKLKYTNLNTKQLKFKNFINDEKYPIVFGIGPPGTGKTLIATYEAVNALESKKYDKIIITRPAVTVDEELGYLKGNLNEKMQPYIQPIFDYLLDYYSRDQLNTLIINNKLEISPIAYLRGRTFKNAFVIADEVQNCTPNQFKMLLTRIGLNSKLVAIGDPGQSDLDKMNGLQDFINKLTLTYKDINSFKIFDDGFGLVFFDNLGIKRHKIIENIMNIYK